MTQSREPLAEVDVRTQLKRVARELVAERGVRSVSVREIAQTARQRNLGVVAYYFGTKEGLIREILIDGAERIEARRAGYLAALEAAGGPVSIADAVAAIILPSAEFADRDPVYGSAFNRFLAQVSFSHPGLIDATLEGRWNRAYQQCLTHLRRLLPQLDPATQGRRFVFLATYISAVLTQRETMLADGSRAHPTWQAPSTLDEIIATATALLTAPALNASRAFYLGPATGASP